MLRVIRDDAYWSWLGECEHWRSGIAPPVRQFQAAWAYDWVFEAIGKRFSRVQAGFGCSASVSEYEGQLVTTHATIIELVYTITDARMTQHRHQRVHQSHTPTYISFLLCRMTQISSLSGVLSPISRSWVKCSNTAEGSTYENERKQVHNAACLVSGVCPI